MLKEFNLFSSDERVCINGKYIFPKLAKSILSKIDFNISTQDKALLDQNMKEDYGAIVNLSKDFDLWLQYHGRFKSFLIGFGINAENANQPDFKLLRIETFPESTHDAGSMAFIGNVRVSGPHIHWYNQFYRMFLNSGTKKPEDVNEDLYSKKIKQFLADNNLRLFNEDLVKKAVPYSSFLRLYKLINVDRRKMREDGYVTITPKLPRNPKQLLGQILERKII